MKSEFDKLYQLLMEDGEGAAPAGAMADASIVAASMHEPGTDSKDGVYDLFQGGSKFRRGKKRRRFPISRRKTLEH